MNKEEIISKFLQYLETALPNYINISEAENHSHKGYCKMHVYSNRHTHPSSLKTMVKEVFADSIFCVSVTIKDLQKINDIKLAKTAVNVVLDFETSRKIMEKNIFLGKIKEIRKTQNDFEESPIHPLLPSQQEEKSKKIIRGE